MKIGRLRITCRRYQAEVGRSYVSWGIGFGAWRLTREGIWFPRRGDEILWCWPWRRHDGNRWISLTYGAGFRTLVSLDHTAADHEFHDRCYALKHELEEAKQALGSLATRMHALAEERNEAVRARETLHRTLDLSGCAFDDHLAEIQRLQRQLDSANEALVHAHAERDEARAVAEENRKDAQNWRRSAIEAKAEAYEHHESWVDAANAHKALRDAVLQLLRDQRDHYLDLMTAARTSAAGDEDRDAALKHNWAAEACQHLIEQVKSMPEAQ